MKTVYYSIVFKFPGKKKCGANSGNFQITSELNENQILELIEKEAHEKLQIMFGEIFPDEALRYLRNPKIESLIVKPTDPEELT